MILSIAFVRSRPLKRLVRSFDSQGHEGSPNVLIKLETGTRAKRGEVKCLSINKVHPNDRRTLRPMQHLMILPTPQPSQA